MPKASMYITTTGLCRAPVVASLVRGRALRSLNSRPSGHAGPGCSQLVCLQRAAMQRIVQEVMHSCHAAKHCTCIVASVVLLLSQRYVRYASAAHPLDSHDWSTEAASAAHVQIVVMTEQKISKNVCIHHMTPQAMQLIALCPGQHHRVVARICAVPPPKYCRSSTQGFKFSQQHV
jgi:hypothetical protein